VERQAGNLGEPINDAGYLGPELAGNVLGPHIGIFHHIVEQRGHNCGGIQQLLGQDHCHGDGMGHEVLARHPLLPPMRRSAEAEGPIDELEIEPVGVALEHRPEIGSKLG
jgi:hypothetical protein